MGRRSLDAEPFQSGSNLGGRNRQLFAYRPGAESLVDVPLTKPRRIGKEAVTTLTGTCERQTGSVQPVADRARRDAEVGSDVLHALAGIETGDDYLEIRR